MHAYLIIGGSKSQRDEVIHTHIAKLQTHPSDIIALTAAETTIGIADVRQFQKRIALKPRASQMSVGVISDAHIMTTEAQNALLKTLEEPPVHACIFLETESAYALLPTILSRTQIQTLGISPAPSEQTLTRQALKDLFSQTPANQMAYIDNIASTRDEAKAWTTAAILVAREALRAPSEDAISWARYIRRLIRVKEYLEANVQTKLALDSALLDL